MSVSKISGANGVIRAIDRTVTDSERIAAALRAKHEKDVFVDQCKTGSTYMSGPNERWSVDFVAIERSWVNQRVTVYEMKVSRNDFIRDTKWRNYLPYCTHLYFVTPHGLIQPTEVPVEAGLMWLSKTGSRVFVKKIAPQHEIDSLAFLDMLMYIVMWRTKVKEEDSRDSREEVVRRILLDKTGKKSLGYEFAGYIRKKVKEETSEILLENGRLKAENEMLRIVKKTLEAMGLDPDGVDSWNAKRVVKQAVWEMKNGGVAATKVLEAIEELRQRVEALSEEMSGGKGVSLCGCSDDLIPGLTPDE